MDTLFGLKGIADQLKTGITALVITVCIIAILAGVAMHAGKHKSGMTFIIGGIVALILAIIVLGPLVPYLQKNIG